MTRVILSITAVLAVAVTVTTFHLPGVSSIQRGYRGLGMVQLFEPKELAAKRAQNVVPDALPVEEPAGTKASELYQNVKVLGEVDGNEFLRVMNAITAWVSPEQGCSYCHTDEGFAADTLYTKVVARRMLQMTQAINGQWSSHVGQTGVTCYTCHRGQNVPSNIWHRGPQSKAVVADAALPTNVFDTYLSRATEIRVAGTTALPTGNRQSVEQTEWTYGLMMHFSNSLGVNCTYCHNTRTFSDWSQSTPQRTTAWYGIRMVRDLNNSYLDPLTSVFPPHRLGSTGDSPKLNCATCHQGVYKPLFGASMVKDYPELKEALAKTADAGR